MPPAAQGSATPFFRRNLPELDALRGVAVLSVFFYHGFFWSAGAIRGVGGLMVRLTEPGWMGVDLFFALSGFLITGILLDARHSTGYFSNFYIRRILRIWPAHFALLALLLATAGIGWPFALASTFFAANLCALLGVPMQYGPLWSLAVEEQFYLAWPLIVRVASRVAVVAIALVVLFAEPVLRYLTYRHHDVDGLYTYTWLRLDGLALGALVAVFVRSRWLTKDRLGYLGGILALLGALAVAAGGAHGIMTRRQPLGAALQLSVVALESTAVLCLVMWVGQSRFRRAVQPGVLRFFGEISYGLYLIHLLAFWWYDRIVAAVLPSLRNSGASFGLLVVRFVIAATVAVTLATLSRRHYEQSFLALKGRLAPDRSRAKLAVAVQG